MPRIAFPLGLVTLALALALAHPADAQVAPRHFTVTVGAGNALGWLGVQGEMYLGSEQDISVFAGLGWTPEIDPGDPDGPAGALGARGYIGGDNHRGFLELSVSQVLVTRGFRLRRVDAERHYGPGLQVGWQYVSDGGFTVALSVGGGFGFGVDGRLDDDGLGGMGGIAVGYTW